MNQNPIKEKKAVAPVKKTAAKIKSGCIGDSSSDEESGKEIGKGKFVNKPIQQAPKQTLNKKEAKPIVKEPMGKEMKYVDSS